MNAQIYFGSAGVAIVVVLIVVVAPSTIKGFWAKRAKSANKADGEVSSDGDGYGDCSSVADVAAHTHRTHTETESGTHAVPVTIFDIATAFGEFFCLPFLHMHNKQQQQQQNIIYKSKEICKKRNETKLCHFILCGVKI